MSAEAPGRTSTRAASAARLGYCGGFRESAERAGDRLMFNRCEVRRFGSYGMREGGRKKLTSSQTQTHNDIVSNSTCAIYAYHHSGVITALHIIFTGPAAHFPSTSNDKEIGFRFLGRAAPGGGGITIRTSRGIQRVAPFIKRSEKALARLEAASTLFRQQTIGAPFPLSFGARPVHVTILLAEQPGRWDSHNAAKPIADWLEEVGVIDDDSRAEVQTAKKSEYDFGIFDQTSAIAEKSSLLVFVQDRQNVKSLYEQTILESYKVASGRLQLVG